MRLYTNFFTTLEQAVHFKSVCSYRRLQQFVKAKASSIVRSFDCIVKGENFFQEVNDAQDMCSTRQFIGSTLLAD